MSTSILIASPCADELGAFSAALAAKPDTTVGHASDAPAALSFIRDNKPDLVIVDSRLNGYEEGRLVRDMLRINAMINFIVLGDMPEEEFHERTEGLGILMQLPTTSGTDQAEMLWQQYQQLF